MEKNLNISKTQCGVIVHNQLDGMAMESRLAPVFENMFMERFEKNLEQVH